ncbi:hypothetical protein PS662_04509 [Pseudomonas fluorescens]|uniref:Uncharacterized protein n=1 Tax=Pseudomonas fluorescens TaxID=294 RepID=A0A5E6W4Z7_PSEFL|nr:hypothetical protein PS662_04509 [Pseudomonas fluorescens]
MSDCLLRYFIQVVMPFEHPRETPVTAGFSREFNDLQNPANTPGPWYRCQLIR